MKNKIVYRYKQFNKGEDIKKFHLGQNIDDFMLYLREGIELSAKENYKDGETQQIINVEGTEYIFLYEVLKNKA